MRPVPRESVCNRCGAAHPIAGQAAASAIALVGRHLEFRLAVTGGCGKRLFHLYPLEKLTHAGDMMNVFLRRNAFLIRADGAGQRDYAMLHADTDMRPVDA